MKNFLEWFKTADNGRPWLVLGKGPTFALRHQYDLNQYNTVSLNHVIKEQMVFIASVVDYEVVGQCSDAILNNAKYLVMPFYPHVNGDFGGTVRLDDLVKTDHTLNRLDSEGRLLWYNLSSCKKSHGSYPVVPFAGYSGGIILSLLATAGAKTVFSLGIDGGADYSREFEHLKNQTHNKPDKYNVQFEHMAKIIMKTGVRYSPLYLDSPVRVYVGTCEEQMLSTKVLQYSIQRHASISTEIIPMNELGVEIPVPEDEFNRPRTPFSFQRFLIPKANDYKGRAIYMDSDMLVFKDIRLLWTVPFNGADLLYTNTHDDKSRSEFSVMLLDCEKLRWDINKIVQQLNSGHYDYTNLMFEMCIADDPRPSVDYTWNSIENYEDGKTALIHYTYMKFQPWVYPYNKWGSLWIKELISAVDEGFIKLDYIADHVARGFVRPSLLYQVENRIVDSSSLPPAVERQDKGFVAPLTRSWTQYQAKI